MPFDEFAPDGDMTKIEMAAITPRRITNAALEKCAEFFVNLADFFTERDPFIYIPSNGSVILLHQDTKQSIPISASYNRGANHLYVINWIGNS
jgi:hypothetical protein